MFMSGLMQLVVGIVVVVSAITKWQWMGSMRDNFPYTENDTFRLIAGVVGGVVAVLGLVMMLLA